MAGELISYANFSNAYYGGLLLNKTGTGVTKVYSAYVSSPSWWAQITIDKEYISRVDITVSAAYWNGSTWVDAWSDKHSFGKPETGSWTYKYYHNSTLGSTSGDVADAVLWEIYLEYFATNNRIRFWTYSGGAGCMPESTYNNLYRGRPIYSSGRLGASSRYDAGDQGRKRDEALSIFSQSANSGTSISGVDEEKLVAYKYN